MIETCVKKEKNTKELKEKFASAFIKGKLHETEIKADRVKVGTGSIRILQMRFSSFATHIFRYLLIESFEKGT